MKKLLTLLLCFALVFSLCACGGESAETPNEEKEPAVNQEPETNDPSAQEPEPGEDPSEEPQDMVELVKGYIDKPIEELYAVIGEPLDTDYAPSCLGDGEDGMLIYDGFIVYTYREGDSEVVFDVE